MDIKYKAELVYMTGHTVVAEEYKEAVLKELEENYNGIYYGDIEMNGLVLIEKAK